MDDPLLPPSPRMPATPPAAPSAADCEAVGADIPPAKGLERHVDGPPLPPSPPRTPATPPAVPPAVPPAPPPADDCEAVVAGTPPAGRGRYVDETRRFGPRVLLALSSSPLSPLLSPGR